MRIFATTKEELIKDDLGLKDVLSKYVGLVFESRIPVALDVSGETVSLNYVDTLVGPAVVGFTSEEISLELIKTYLDKVLLERHSFPKFMVDISNLIDSWKGKMSVGILSAEKDEIRFGYRKELSKIASQIINLSGKDLYVFPTEHISVHKDVKLALSSNSSEVLGAIRQAFIVDRYVSNSGLCTYKALQDLEVHVDIEEEDVKLVQLRLISQDLKEFGEKAGLSLRQAYRTEKLLEEKYWLFFNVGIDCYLYTTGLRNWSRKV